MLFHPADPLSVSGYTAYTTRLTHAFERDGVVELHPWTPPGPHVLGPASSSRAVRAAHRALARRRARAGHAPAITGLEPEFVVPGEGFYSTHNEGRIESFRARMLHERIDVFYIADWGGVGTLLFEACRRAEVPYVVAAVDYKPICAQTQLLERGTRICEGPTSNERCVACLTSLGQHVTADAVDRRQRALARHLDEAARVVAFTETHVHELERWLSLGRERYTVVPFAVPPAGPQFHKALEAFEHPLRFAFVARTCHEWGLESLLEAWQAVGRGPEVATLDVYTNAAFSTSGLDQRFAAQIASGSIRVHIGSVFERIDEIHQTTAAVVVPSQWKNTGSSSALEALGRGTPVVTEDRHGVFDDLPASMRELAYDADRPNALAEKLDQLVEHPDRLARAAHEMQHNRPFSDHVAALRRLFFEASERSPTLLAPGG
jgi:glycosyltransferase involved in cell wall biosynthesis